MVANYRVSANFAAAGHDRFKHLLYGYYTTRYLF
jgi:hypothetical protein